MSQLDDLIDMDGRDLVLTLHPINQASHEHTYKAGDELGELVRYLVHATLPERVHRALPYPISVDDLVKNLRYAVEGMPQLLEQIAARLALLRADPDLATDSPNDGVSAEQRAAEAEENLRVLADQIRGMSGQWSVIRRNTGRLKFESKSDADAV